MDRGSQLSKDDEDDEDDEEDEEEEERRTRQEEAEEEKEEEKEEKEEEEEATDIKSNNPHLAGGESMQLYRSMFKQSINEMGHHFWNPAKVVFLLMHFCLCTGPWDINGNNTQSYRTFPSNHL